MSRLYGRALDVYEISKYLLENYKGTYKKDNTVVSPRELEIVPALITPYLKEDHIKYLDDQQIEMAYNSSIRETIYSGVGEENNIIFFPSKKMKEEYKRDLVYFMGDLLKRKSFDRMPTDFDISCQYSEVVPLLIEYLFLKESGKEDTFEDKHLTDLKLNAKEYVKTYERHERLKDLLGDEDFLFSTLSHLVPLSSMDATLQIRDKYEKDKDALIELIYELIENENHNREEIMKSKDIDTYGFKTLRKEIKGRK